MLNHFIVLVAVILIPLSSGYSQTLFSRPDTIPNYSGYRYFDQCLEAVNRVIYDYDIKNPLWPDTAAYDLRLMNTPVPEKAVNIGRVCLSGINLDLVPVRDYHLLVRLLLLVNRDDDANRFVNSALDTISSSFKDTLFYEIGQEYRSARPKRMLLLEKLLMRDDSQYSQSIHEGGDVLRAVELAQVALDLGQNEYATSVANEIYNKDGKYAAKIPKISVKDLRVYVFPFLIEVSEYLTDKGAVSLISNSIDYRKFQEEVWSRLSNEEMPEVLGSTIRYLGVEMPQISGNFWHTNIRNNESNADNFKAEKVQKLSDQSIPAKGKINLIAFFHGGCHLESKQISTRAARDAWGRNTRGCWTSAAMIKRLKQRFPDIHITIVSKTFGSFGDAPPLEPVDEADTLADYFLNFHKIPGIHVAVTTEFVRIPGYDGRRVDLESKFETDLNERQESGLGFSYNTKITNSGNFLLVDENGLIFHVATVNSVRMEPILIKKINAVVGRRIGASDNSGKTN